MPADFQFMCDPPAARVRIGGDLDLAAGDTLEDLLERLEALGFTRIDLDLAGLTFVDVPVLDLLRHEQLRLRVRGGDLQVVAASPHYERACERAEADSLLPEPAVATPAAATPPPGAAVVE